MIGQLSQVQKNLLKPFIQGKIVHDLGAGDLALSREILALGAEKVIAVDKNILPSSKDPRLEIVTLDFRDFAGCIDVAFVSWPSNWPTDLHWVIHSTKIVIYLGSNMDGNMCGYKKLWDVFAQRDVLAYSLDRQNTLIVYGKRLRDGSRLLLPEEYAAMHIHDGHIISSDLFLTSNN